jgi:hypothetical protein
VELFRWVNALGGLGGLEALGDVFRALGGFDKVFFLQPFPTTQLHSLLSLQTDFRSFEQMSYILMLKKKSAIY